MVEPRESMMQDWPNRKHSGWRYVPQNLWQESAIQSAQISQCLPKDIVLPDTDWIVIVDGQICQKDCAVTIKHDDVWDQPQWPLHETLWSWSEQAAITHIQITSPNVTIIEYYTGLCNMTNLKLELSVPSNQSALIQHKIISAEDQEHCQAIVKVQLKAGDSSCVKYYQSQEHSIKRLGYYTLDCDNAASVSVHTLATSSPFARDIHNYDLSDKVQHHHTHFSLVEGAGFKEQRVYLHHQGQQVESFHQVRGIAINNGQSIHISQANVDPGAVDCNVVQKLDFRMTDNAKVVSQPDIRVAVDAVKASHGSTIAAFDTQHLQYLKTRGLTHAQATGLLTHAFAQPILDYWQDIDQSTVLKLRTKLDKIGDVSRVT